MLLTLMNKDVPVLVAEYLEDAHAFTKIVRKLNPEWCPLALMDGTGSITLGRLNDWWLDRAIPASRDQIAEVERRLQALGVSDLRVLLERAYGMSLSDRYWIRSDPQGPGWDDLNFFDNDFTGDLGMLTFDGTSPEHPDLVSPNSSLGGDLRKKWVIENGRRVLLKEGSGLFLQEPYNELIATKLYGPLLQPGEFVPYELSGSARRPISACPNMLGPDEELVPAWDVITSRKTDRHHNAWQNIATAFSDLLGADARPGLTKMFVLDVALANRDRHYRNFGLIRDVETLRFKRLAPIFDSGSSLWCWARDLEEPIDYRVMYKPFGLDGYEAGRQLSFFTDMSWLDVEALRRLPDIVSHVLSQNRYLGTERVELVRKACEKNVDQVISHASTAGKPRSRKRI